MSWCAGKFAKFGRKLDTDRRPEDSDQLSSPVENVGPALVTGLKVRYPGLAQTRRETLRKEKATEEKGAVDRVARERVPEEWHAGKVARHEASIYAGSCSEGPTRRSW